MGDKGNIIKRRSKTKQNPIIFFIHISPFWGWIFFESSQLVLLGKQFGFCFLHLICFAYSTLLYSLEIILSSLFSDTDNYISGMMYVWAFLGAIFTDCPFSYSSIDNISEGDYIEKK